MSGELTEDEFKPLRLMNGVYLQLPCLYAADCHSGTARCHRGSSACLRTSPSPL